MIGSALLIAAAAGGFAFTAITPSKEMHAEAPAYGVRAGFELDEGRLVVQALPGFRRGQVQYEVRFESGVPGSEYIRRLDADPNTCLQHKIPTTDVVVRMCAAADR